MERFGVPVLGALDEKDHQECDDRCSGIDHELPRVGVVKQGARCAPDDGDCHTRQKRPGRADRFRDSVREVSKQGFHTRPFSHAPKMKAERIKAVGPNGF